MMGPRIAAPPIPVAGGPDVEPSPDDGTPVTPVSGPVEPSFDEQVASIEAWFAEPRFDGIVRLHTAREVAEQRGTILADHRVARDAAIGFHALLRRRFAEGRSIITFGPYSPGQAVVQRRLGLEATYVGGWATSAKGSAAEDPGPDLASYPLGSVPDEAASIVRALIAADRNQRFERSRLSEAARRATPGADYRPFIVADADTGHGGDAHVRNLIRRFVEAGVPGYHIEDQRPGAKKCGHQDGKVLVAQHEQNKRLNAARLQLDIMGVPGIIVARTDAEAATLLDDISDERDQPFVLGATEPGVPPFRVGYVAILRRLHDLGLDEVRGHELFAVPDDEQRAAMSWLDATGLTDWIRARVRMVLESAQHGTRDRSAAVVDDVDARYVEAWQEAARVRTYGEAVAAALAARTRGATPADLEGWQSFAAGASLSGARARARELGVDPFWDPDLPRTADGYYRVQGGIPYAIAKALGAAPFADLLWMETKTADLTDARRFAAAIHAVHPDKMLAYNLSPSFNWDTTGMSEDEMRAFPDELGRLGFVFDFVTYGGHQIDGLAAEEFTTDLREDGMLALARLQRRLRLIESPYRTPQTLVGGNRADAALMAASGRTASTRAMGARSTQHQHLVETEASPTLLADWLTARVGTGAATSPRFQVTLRPRMAGSNQLRLRVSNGPRSWLEVDYTPLGRQDQCSIAIERVEHVGIEAIVDIVRSTIVFIAHRERATSFVVWPDLDPMVLDLVRGLGSGGTTDGSASYGPMRIDPAMVRAMATELGLGRAPD